VLYLANRKLQAVLRRAGAKGPGLPSTELAPRVAVGSVAFDPLTVGAASALVRDELARGSGGLLVVVGRESHDRGVESVHQAATVVLAGSATAVWASWLLGRGLPQRVRPAALAEALCGVAASDGRRVYLVGGAPGGPGVPSEAQRAAAVLGLRFRGLHVAASACPPATGPSTGTAAAGLPTGAPATGPPTGEALAAGPAATGPAATGPPAATAATVPAAGPTDPATGVVTAWSAVLADVMEAKPDLVLISTDAEVRERILTELRVALPGAWLVDCAGIIDGLVPSGSARSRRWPFRLLPRRA
jgi:UDP-N-acetyl-D-mannosaminuronic acid transferase (WecB/TagA/CpsF family)